MPIPRYESEGGHPRARGSERLSQLARAMKQENARIALARVVVAAQHQITLLRRG